MRTVTASLVFAALFVCPGLAQRSADQFTNVRLVVHPGSPAGEIDVLIRFEDDAVVIRQGRSLVKHIRDTAITGAEHRYAKAHPGPSAVGTHWLAIAADGDVTLLRLGEHNYRMALLAFEGRIGIRVTARELAP